MTCSRFFQFAIWLPFVILLTIGCSSASAPTSAPIPQADTPIPQTDTPVPTATLIPTDTPEPSPSPTSPPTDTATPLPPTETPTPAFVIPEPGAVLNGDMKVNDTAESAIIELVVSDDGTSLSQITVTVFNLFIDCSDTFAGVERKGSIAADSMELSLHSVPITEGLFEASLSYGGKLSGKFSSPSEASGWINIIDSVQSGALCDFGEWYWSASSG